MNNNQKSKFFRNVNNQPQSNSEISYKSFTNASKASMTAFKNSLIFYKTELNEIKEDLQNSSSIKAYEKSLEAKCRAQLKTEETIAELKTLHGFDINDDENVLPTELKLEIESIQNTNDMLIKKTESYEQTLISESESCETKKRIKEILSDLDEKTKTVDDWIGRAFSGSAIKKYKLNQAKQDLKSN